MQSIILITESPTDYYPAELEQVRQSVPLPHFAQLGYSTLAALNRAILALQGAGRVLVDNDHGLIATLCEIRVRIARREAWDRAPAWWAGGERPRCLQAVCIRSHREHMSMSTIGILSPSIATAVQIAARYGNEVSEITDGWAKVAQVVQMRVPMDSAARVAI